MFGHEDSRIITFWEREHFSPSETDSAPENHACIHAGPWNMAAIYCNNTVLFTSHILEYNTFCFKISSLWDIHHTKTANRKHDQQDYLMCTDMRQFI